MPLPELYTLDQVAERFGWTRRKLIARLKSYAIGTIGKGEEARLTDLEVQSLLVRERDVAAWNVLPHGEKIRRRKEFARQFRETYQRDERAKLLAPLPPLDPETKERIRKSIERSRRMREAYARKKLVKLLKNRWLAK